MLDARGRETAAERTAVQRSLLTRASKRFARLGLVPRD